MRIANLRRSCNYAGRPFCQSVYTKARYPLGIAFDIDGVLVRGGQPIEGASQALRQLFADINNPSQARIPHIFLTNGGGVPESIKALELSSLLGVKILPQQVFLGHTPFNNLKDRYEFFFFEVYEVSQKQVKQAKSAFRKRGCLISKQENLRFGDSHVLAVGKGEPSRVMTTYGYRNVMSMEDYVSHFKEIDPLAKHKHWSTNAHQGKKVFNDLPCIKAVDAVFIVSDPVDWGRDIQVLCDVLRSGGCPGRRHGDQPPLYFAADDFEYQAAFSVERLGMGAFRIALEAIFNRMSKKPLAYTSFGKPKVEVFQGAEISLLKVAEVMEAQAKLAGFERLYMIGDNPSTDILGAKQAGTPWFSILTRTGCFKGKDNDELYPADLVVDNVHEAVQFILKEHGLD